MDPTKIRVPKVRDPLTRGHIINAADFVARGYQEALCRSAASFAADAIRELTGVRVRHVESGLRCDLQQRDYAAALPLLDYARRQERGLVASDGGHSVRVALELLVRIAKGRHR